MIVVANNFGGRNAVQVIGHGHKQGNDRVGQKLVGLYNGIHHANNRGGYGVYAVCRGGCGATYATNHEVTVN